MLGMKEGLSVEGVPSDARPLLLSAYPEWDDVVVAVLGQKCRHGEVSFHVFD